jgi:HK97 family phage prohead protease
MKTQQSYFSNIAERAEGMPENRFKAVISNGTVDRYGTAFDPEGAKMENYMKNPVVFLKHDRSNLPIGRATRLELKNGNWEAEFVVDGFTELERLVIAKLNAGTLNAVSIGAVVNPERVEKMGNGDVVFREWELHEFSVVDVPGNPEALVTARDFGQIVLQHQEFRMQQDAIRSAVERELVTVQRDLSDIKEAIEHLTMAIEVLTDIIETEPSEAEDDEYDDEDEDESEALDRLADAIANWRKSHVN